MYFAAPAAEYVLGGRDPGAVRERGYPDRADGNRSSPPTASPRPCRRPMRDLFFPSYSNPDYYSVRFMGFHLRDPDAGTVTGQFPQGYPIWIAIAYGLDGVTGTRE